MAVAENERRVTADTTFGGLSPEEWDRLAGDRFYSTSAWLRFCTAETNVPGRAVVTRSGGEPAWAVPVRALGGLPEWTSYRWNGHLEEFGLPLLPPTGTLVGPPEGFQTHFLAPPGERSTDALAELVTELRELARSGDEHDGPACVAMYVTTEDVHALGQAGVTVDPVLLDADAWIPLPEGGWQGWLDSFPSRRRKSIRRDERLFREAGYRLEHVPIADCWWHLGGLAAATLGKYGGETTAEHENISMRRIVDCLGDLATVSLCSLPDGDPVGFCIYYVWGETIFARWAGFDYDRLVGASEYFNVIFYSLVRRAPEVGARRIHVAGAKKAAKAR